MNERGSIIIDNEVFLHNHKDYKNMGTDEWVFDEGDSQKTGPKLRVRLTYSYSDVAKFTSLLDEWDDDIDFKFQNDEKTGYKDIVEWI
tara:strand:+ start:426 stop:689 length:264 start_codon:yes stop_codon:yes gene_type:complete